MAQFTAGLGSLTFNVEDANGNIYVCSDLQGWDDPVSSGAVNSRTDADGGWSTRAHYAPRPLHLSGTVIAPAPGTLDALIDALLASIPFDAAAPLTVTRDGVARRAYVRLDGAPTINLAGRNAATFDIPLIAADPFRYAEAQSSLTLALPNVTGGLTIATTAPFSIGATSVTGQGDAINAGTALTYPVIRLNGSVSNPTLTNATTGAALTYNGSIAAGDFVLIDCAAKTVLYNGTATRRGLVSGSFPSLSPGDNTVTLSSPTYDPTASALLTWRSAWR